MISLTFFFVLLEPKVEAELFEDSTYWNELFVDTIRKLGVKNSCNTYLDLSKKRRNKRQSTHVAA